MFYPDFVVILAMLSGAFASSCAIHRRRAFDPPALGTAIRLRQGASTFVASFCGELDGEWALSKPYLLTQVSPLRPGKSYLAEFDSAAGIVNFLTHVKVCCGDGTLVVTAPERLELRERRMSTRQYFLRTESVALGGVVCDLVNLSQGGAAVNCPSEWNLGAEAEFRYAGKCVPASVLDCHSNGTDARPRYSIRLVFANPEP